jgi:bifunctional UDP-N-acetylglucosamine pyrophosphorylase / glucosamine-1-phosphate N-acetyltransferase
MDASPTNVAVVLAAGKGTRMKSDLPKVLVEVCRRPMLHYVLDALEAGGVRRTIVVIGHRADLVRTALDGRQGVEFAVQTQQLGTGHAVMTCRDLLAGYDGPVLVVAGDSPMMQSASITALLADFERRPAACILGTARKEKPDGVGRVLRDAQGNFLGIVEHKDATAEQLRITEVNMSYYVFRCGDLLAALEHVRADNSQGEYYLTDVPGVLVAQGREVRALCVLRPCESLSINTVAELAEVEKAMQEGYTKDELHEAL